MSKQRLSLIDILNPPVNPWLEEISQRNAKVPAGVRVVRLSDDDGDDQPNHPVSPRSRRTHVSRRQTA